MPQSALLRDAVERGESGMSAKQDWNEIALA
jgi:hypothetical protein